MAAFVDELAAVVAYLRADADVAALVGTRVFGGELPDDQAASMPRTAIVLHDAGFGSGGGALGMTNNSNLPINQSTKMLKAYGATPFEARAVWNAAAGALKALGQTTGRARVPVGATTVMLYSATPAGPVGTREPEVDWPLCYSTFNLMAAENSVA